MHPLAQIEALHGTYDDNDYRAEKVARGGPRPQRDDSAVGEPPCTGCPLAVRCGARELACAQFAAYAETNAFGNGPRVPNRAIYRAVMAS